MYNPPEPFSLNRRIPIALVFTILLQVGAVVWWASTMQAQNNYRDVRISALEIRRNTDTERLEHILERLSRIEARSDALLDVMQRVDLYFSRKK